MKILGAFIIVITFISSAQARNHNGRIVRIINLKSGLCLDAAGGRQTNNTNLQQFKCHGGANQAVRIEQVNDSYATVPVYRLVDVNSGLCYDVLESSYYDRGNLQLYKCHGRSNQTFQIADVLARGNGINDEYFQIIARNSLKCLDVEDQSIYGNANLQQYRCKSILGQIFILKDTY